MGPGKRKREREKETERKMTPACSELREAARAFVLSDQTDARQFMTLKLFTAIFGRI